MEISRIHIVIQEVNAILQTIVRHHQFSRAVSAQVKLDNVSLSYMIPVKNNPYLKGASLYLTGQNDRIKELYQIIMEQESQNG